MEGLHEAPSRGPEAGIPRHMSNLMNATTSRLDWSKRYMIKFIWVSYLQYLRSIITRKKMALGIRAECHLPHSAGCYAKTLPSNPT